ncbi:hypothetical protein [Phenylobacterium sp.]|uniref:hypothetical protein n=1 Tax=Phenylobacterium sp. TaxID=1871053 RepID=UPI002DF13030|nr:hypothetical protein [Phenylobacterium sp.]
MNPVIDRLKLIFVGVFLVANIVMLVWEFGWVMPRENCEKAHKWWDGGQRVCAQPILISDITGRVIDNPKARAEALKAIGRAPAAKAAPAPAKPAAK